MTFGAHFTDGYSLGAISMALTVLTPRLHLNGTWQGLIGASALIGLFLGSFIMGQVSDRIGRQKIFLFNFALITAASLCQLFARTATDLFIIRLIIGFGLGGDYSVGVTLLSEVVPKKPRGLLLGCLSAVWTVGYTLSTIIGYFIQDSHPGAWRYLLASAAIPAFIVLVFRIGTPESPRWLLKMGRREEAQAVVDRYIGKGVIIEEPQRAEQSTLKTLFIKRYRKQTAFAALFFVCDVLPYFAVYTFLPEILSALGMKDTFTTDLLLNIMLVVGAAIGMWATLALTRRQFSIGGFAVCAVALLLITFLPHGWTAIIIIAFVAFTLGISALGNLTGVFPPEVLPTEVRASGVGFATAMSRGGSAIGTFLLPIGLTSIGLRPSLFVLALVVVLAVVMCYFWAPETKDLTLTNAVKEAARVAEVGVGSTATEIGTETSAPETSTDTDADAE